MSGNRDYQVLADGEENMQFFWIESTVPGLEDLRDCRQQIYMALEFKNHGDTWQELWSQMSMAALSDSNLATIYVEEGVNTKKIAMEMTQKGYEKYIKLEFDTKADSHAVTMRIAYKKLNGDVLANLSTGEFTITVFAEEKDEDYVHPCAGVSLTKKSQSTNK